MKYSDKVEAALEALLATKVIITQSDTMLSFACIVDHKTLDILSNIKSRRGPFILTGARIEQLTSYMNLEAISTHKFDVLTKYYIHPTSFILPANEPSIITGDTDQLCIRILHPCIMRDISILGNIPLLSTSVNPAGDLPAHNRISAMRYFDLDYPFFLDTSRLPSNKPSTIIELLNSKTIRK
jgi:L-threonylcarbamoyladenylate synthase